MSNVVRGDVFALAFDIERIEAKYCQLVLSGVKSSQTRHPRSIIACSVANTCSAGTPQLYRKGLNVRKGRKLRDTPDRPCSSETPTTLF